MAIGLRLSQTPEKRLKEYQSIKEFQSLLMEPLHLSPAGRNSNAIDTRKILFLYECVHVPLIYVFRIYSCIDWIPIQISTPLASCRHAQPSVYMVAVAIDRRSRLRHFYSITIRSLIASFFGLSQLTRDADDRNVTRASFQNHLAFWRKKKYEDIVFGRRRDLSPVGPTLAVYSNSLLMAHDPPIKCHQTLPMQSNHDRPSHTELYIQRRYTYTGDRIRPPIKQCVCLQHKPPPKKLPQKLFLLI